MPGTGWPEPGGLLPREALGLVRLVAEGGISGMEVVECSPPYDWAEQTSLICARVILDALASMVRVGKLGRKPSRNRSNAWGPYPEDAGKCRSGGRSDQLDCQLTEQPRRLPAGQRDPWSAPDRRPAGRPPR